MVLFAEIKGKPLTVLKKDNKLGLVNMIKHRQYIKLYRFSRAIISVSRLSLLKIFSSTLGIPNFLTCCLSLSLRLFPRTVKIIFLLRALKSPALLYTIKMFP